MTKLRTINTLKNILVKTYHPEAIYIHSSPSWGGADEENDLEVLIIVDGLPERPYLRSNRGVRALRGLKFNEIIIVHTKQEFERLSLEASSLCYTIRKEGTIIYEAL